jgi:hypothetical protein
MLGTSIKTLPIRRTTPPQGTKNIIEEEEQHCYRGRTTTHQGIQKTLRKKSSFQGLKKRNIEKK